MTNIMIQTSALKGSVDGEQRQTRHTAAQTDGRAEGAGAERLTEERGRRDGAVAPRDHDADARLYEGHGEIDDL